MREHLLYNQCMKLEAKLEEAAEYLDRMMKHLYSRERFDDVEFETDLDELCHALNVKIPAGDLTIARSLPREVNRPSIINLKEWIEFNNEYLTKQQ